MSSADFSRPIALEARGCPDAEGIVLFVADSDGPTKRWPSERWVELAGSLGRREWTSPSSPEDV